MKEGEREREREKERTPRITHYHSVHARAALTAFSLLYTSLSRALSAYYFPLYLSLPLYLRATLYALGLIFFAFEAARARSFHWERENIAFRVGLGSSQNPFKYDFSQRARRVKIFAITEVSPW